MEVKQMPIYSEAIGYTAENIDGEQKEVIVLNVAETKGICHGIYYDLFDKQLCEDMGLPMIDAKFPGGAIVVFEDDINISQCAYGFSEFGKRLMSCIADFLRSKKLNVEIDNNDVLIVDGESKYKVASYASCWHANDTITYTVAHISMGMDINLVQKICFKPMEKIPKALHDYGINSNDVLRYLNENMEEFKGKLEVRL